MEIGEKINMFTFLEETEPILRTNGCRRRRGVFLCDCGEVKELDYSAIKTGWTVGCNLCADKSRAKIRTTHNMSKHPLYRKWQDMKNRCYNPNKAKYHNYGGRGIIVCSKWKSDFITFRDWCMSKGWDGKLTIERKDVDGNYEPDNCTLIPLNQQCYNKTNTRWVRFATKQWSLAELCKYLGLPQKQYFRIHFHIMKGKSFMYMYKRRHQKYLREVL